MGRECQLESGDYKWVQFGNGADSGFFSISTTDVGQARFERIENTCVYDSVDDIPAGPPLLDMELGCTLNCPVGLTAIAAEANGQHAPLFTGNAEFVFDRDFSPSALARHH